VVDDPMNGYQFDTEVRENGSPSGHDDIPCALRAQCCCDDRSGLLHCGGCEDGSWPDLFAKPKNAIRIGRGRPASSMKEFRIFHRAAGRLELDVAYAGRICSRMRKIRSEKIESYQWIMISLLLKDDPAKADFPPYLTPCHSLPYLSGKLGECTPAARRLFCWCCKETEELRDES